MRDKSVSIAYPVEMLSEKMVKNDLFLLRVNQLVKRFSRHAIRRMNKIMLPGMSGLSVYYAAKFFFNGMNVQKLIERTSSVTYNFLMALPPSFLFIFSLVPHLPLRNVELHLLHAIRLLVHNQAVYMNISGVIRDFMSRPGYDVLSFGIIMMLFFSSNGMMGLMRSFDKSQTLFKTRNGWQRRWTAIKLTTIMIGVGVITLSVFIIQSEKALTHELSQNAETAKIISFAFLVLLVFLAISMIYTYGPSLKRRFRFASAGAIYATVASVTVTSVFFFLVTNVIHYDRLYGSIGTLIAFMVLVWLNTAIMLIGYELNVNLLLCKLAREKERNMLPSPVTTEVLHTEQPQKK
jgi:membrane protein